MTSISLAFDIKFPELYARDGLIKLDEAFRRELRAADAALATRLDAARSDPDSLDAKRESEFLLALAPHVEDFVADLFGIRREVEALAERHHELAPLYACRRRFVQRH